ncbi:MAG: hypothetical protein PVF78_12410 [Desulfobacterales bacterium]|jgi:hypothetical protein
MKKGIIATAAFLVLIGLGYLIYANWVLQSDPCASIFDQTSVRLEENTKILKEKGSDLLGRVQIQKLSDQADQITADLKTCCILFHDDKIAFDEFLKCQDDYNQYERNIDRLVHLVIQTQTAKQQERYDLVNLRLSHIERNVKDLDVISDQFRAQLKSLMERPSRGYQKPALLTQKSVITETEPNDAYKQGMEIPSGILTGTLSGEDRQDYFRFELDPGSILNLDFTAGDDSENLKIALRNFEGNELWNSGEISSGAVKSTRMLLNNLSGGIYYAVVYAGIGPYKLDLYIEMQNDAGSGTDAGDKITKAIALEPGSSFFGEMGVFDEEDWYRFDIPAGHILKLSFSPDASSEAMKFSLRSFERSEVWYSGVVPAGETRSKRVMMNNASGGTYYLQAYYGSGHYGFGIFIESQNDAASGTDAGDKIAEAFKIIPGHFYSGELGGYDQSDWYRFDIPAGSVLKMTLSNYKENTPMSFSFRNVDGVEVLRLDDIKPGDKSTTRMLVNNTTGGIYFLEAFDGSGSYEFGIYSEQQNDAGLNSDAGDRISEATKITSQRTITGELGGLDQEDWYTFSLSEGKAIRFTSDTDGEPLKLSMGNVARKKVVYTAELTPGVTETFEVPKDIQPPYFLRIYDGSSKYSFEIK